MKIFTSDEIFRFWDYKVSHDTFLLRSGGNEKNIDIVFIGVFYFNCGTMFRGLQIEQAKPEDYKMVEQVKTHENEKLFLIKSENIKHWIGALNFTIYSNSMNSMDHSPLNGDFPGEVLKTS